MTTLPARIDLGRYHAVIFDMDGVLLDSEPIHYEVTAAMLEPHGSMLDHETYRRYLGSTLRAFWLDLCAMYALPHPPEHYEAEYGRRVLAALERPIEPQPGIVALIERLRARELPFAVASSATRQTVDASLRAIGLHGVFSVSIAGDEVKRGKPDPEIFLTAAARLGVEPARCLVLEDAPGGVQAARAAGMDVVAIRTVHNAGYPFESATWLVNSVEDLL